MITRRGFILRRGALASLMGFSALAAVLLVGGGVEGDWQRWGARALVAAAALLAMDRVLRPGGGRPIPVLTYHSVAGPQLRSRWERLGWGNLTIGWELFQWQLGYLSRRGYRSGDLEDLYRHVKGEKPATAKTLVITFDDGYVDNWVYAAPLLSRYGFKATVFATSEFLESSDELRPTLADVWSGRIKREALPCEGYLAWGELKELERRGVMQVQGHATSHTWYFAGDRIVDFYHNPDHYVWMFWNLFPEQKCRWQQEDLAEMVGRGRPVYAFHRCQVRRRYFEDEGLAKELMEVAAAEGEGFFEVPGWREKLKGVAAAYRRRNPRGDGWESEPEYWQRVREDLAHNKRELEERLGRPVDYLAWPGDAFSAGLRRLALEELGFRATTESRGLNRTGEDASWIGRAHVESNFEGTRWAWLDRLEFVAKVELFAGNLWYIMVAAPVAVMRRLILRRRMAGRPVVEPAVPEGAGLVEGPP